MVPQASHPMWAAVIIGDKEPDFQYLATKMLLNNLRHVYMSYPTPDRMAECIEKLRVFFERNRFNKKVRSDLKSILR